MKRRCKGCREWKEFDGHSNLHGFCQECQNNRIISEDDEQIFRMVHFEHLSLVDVAWQLDVNVSVVSDALTRVKKVMKKLHIKGFPDL